MELVADVDPRVVAAVTRWSAEHGVSVGQTVETAVVEYMLDVDAGLLMPPQVRPTWEQRRVPRYMRGRDVA
jgi:hypothetical protein